MSNPNTTQFNDGLTGNPDKTAVVDNQALQERIIKDIKEMDMDNFLALVEHMYSVKTRDLNGEDIEITVDENQGFTSLSEIF